MIGRDDRDAFMDRIDQQVLDEFLETMYGHEAREIVELDDQEFTLVELQFLVDSAITGHNEARGNGDMFEAMIYYRLLQKLLGVDDRVKEMHDEAQRMSQHPLTALFGGQ